MSDYEGTLKDIEESLGFVPDFMKALPEDVLTQDWPLMKKYVLGESKIPGKYREMIALAVAAAVTFVVCVTVTPVAALVSLDVGWAGCVPPPEPPHETAKMNEKIVTAVSILFMTASLRVI